MDYRMIGAPGGFAGGVLGLSEDMISGGAKPTWLGYFGVDDVDASVAAIIADGGQVHLPPMDVPDVGRMAMVTDPQHIPFYVMRGASDQDSTAYQRHGVGHVSWNELLVPDDAAALAFYAKHFNLKKVGAMSMGEMGEYSFIAHGSDEAIGAAMPTSPGARSGWGFYFRVPEIDAAKARVEAAGGTVTSGPMEVPGGEWVLNATDPEGVTFGLVAPVK
jgi:predicted enzyme related to lactoylglutathione lyase